MAQTRPNDLYVWLYWNNQKYTNFQLLRSWALLKAENNKFTPADIENILTRSAYKSRELSSYVEDGSYLDLSAALELAKTFTPTSEDTVTGIRKMFIFAGYTTKVQVPIFSHQSLIELITNGGWINEALLTNQCSLTEMMF